MYDHPAVADALIKHRDGIMGAWAGSLSTTPDLLYDSAASLERWEPWVRAAVFDFEMLSHLHMTRHSENYADTSGGPNRSTLWSFTLWHVDVPPTAPDAVAPVAALRRIASFIRPTTAIFRQQLAYIHSYSDLREDRASEIMAQLAPPIAFWSSVANLHPNRTRWTIELLDAALRLAMFVEMRFKHALACRRPVEYSPQVQPMILTPGHATLPSGHATEAHIVAYVLWRLLKKAEPPPPAPPKNPAWGDQLMRQAARIAINRTVAGVHFPVDSAAGQLLGLTLGEYFVRRCGVIPQYHAWRFDGPRFGPAADFDWRQQYNMAADAHVSAPFTDNLGLVSAQMSVPLNWLWYKALAEWP